MSEAEELMDRLMQRKIDELEEVLTANDELLQSIQAENDRLNHAVKCLQNENRGLYAKLELLRVADGGPGPTRSAFVSVVNKSTDEG